MGKLILRVLTVSSSICHVPITIFQHDVTKSVEHWGSISPPCFHVPHKALPHVTRHIEFPLVCGNEPFPASPVYLAKPNLATTRPARSMTQTAGIGNNRSAYR